MMIKWSIDGNIGFITLNQPPSNTMTMEFFRDLGQLVSEINSAGNIKALIIHGKERHYSSGADITELLDCVDGQVMTENYRTFLRLEQSEIPLISAIRGVCIGSAFELALFSHFRICSGDAVLGLPESTFNLMPGVGGINKVATLAGTAKAIELALRGHTFPASDAFAMGLVDIVVPKQEVMTLAINFARSLPEKIMLESRAFYLHKYLKPLHASS